MNKIKSEKNYLYQLNTVNIDSKLSIFQIFVIIYKYYLYSTEKNKYNLSIIKSLEEQINILKDKNNDLRLELANMSNRLKGDTYNEDQ